MGHQRLSWTTHRVPPEPQPCRCPFKEVNRRKPWQSVLQAPSYCTRQRRISPDGACHSRKCPKYQLCFLPAIRRAMRVRRGAPSALGQACAASHQDPLLVELTTYPSEGRASLGLSKATPRPRGPLPVTGRPATETPPQTTC